MPASNTSQARCVERPHNPVSYEEAVRQHGALVRKIAFRWRRRAAWVGLQVDDLVQEGLMGLLKALDQFDPSRGVSFTNYAGRKIHAAMQHAIQAQDRGTGRISAHELELMNRMAATRDAFYTRHGHDPSLEELHLRLGGMIRASGHELTVTHDHIQFCLELAHRPRTLSLETDAREGRDGHVRVLHDTVPSFLQRPDFVLLAKEQLIPLCRVVTIVQAYAKTRPERERAILTHRLGLFGKPVLCQRELGILYGVSRQAICQAEDKAFRRLRSSIHLTGEEIRNILAVITNLEGFIAAAI